MDVMLLIVMFYCIDMFKVLYGFLNYEYIFFRGNIFYKFFKIIIVFSGFVLCNSYEVILFIDCGFNIYFSCVGLD